VRERGIERSKLKRSRLKGWKLMGRRRRKRRRKGSSWRIKLEIESEG